MRIIRFGVFQTAKMMGVLYALIGVLVLPFFLFVSMMSPDGGPFSTGIALIIPVLYGVLVFVFTAIACVAYNLAAGWTGGIEIEIQSVSSTPS